MRPSFFACFSSVGDLVWNLPTRLPYCEHAPRRGSHSGLLARNRCGFRSESISNSASIQSNENSAGQYWHRIEKMVLPILDAESATDWNGANPRPKPPHIRKTHGYVFRADSACNPVWNFLEISKFRVNIPLEADSASNIKKLWYAHTLTIQSLCIHLEIVPLLFLLGINTLIMGCYYSSCQC